MEFHSWILGFGVWNFRLVRVRKGVNLLSLKNICTIAKYEVKTLLRSWFFRIFAGLSLIVLTFLNVAFFTDAFDAMPWPFRGIPASIPYFNVMLLNLAQAVIAIFLASDFIKRDRKSNTTEVIYMRSMSNADYILGKSLGLLQVFLGLNILMLIIAAVINVVFSDAPFQAMPYLYYLLLISLPTLIYIFGLSFFIMSVIGNQAVTFILLLGYFAISLIALNFKFNAVFDGVAFFLPFAWSDFVGFSNLSAIVMQRLAYASIGLGLVFVSVLLFKRLPQSRAMQAASRVLSVIFIGLGVLLFVKYTAIARSGESLRAGMKALNDNYAHLPVVTVSDYDLSFEHRDKDIDVTASLRLRSDEPLSELVFTLNPGLHVVEVKMNGEPVQARREKHLLIIEPAGTLAPGDAAELIVHYAGRIDEQACYIAASEEERNGLNQAMLYKLGKKYAYVSDDYVLLTKEAGWYPVPGVGHGKGLVAPNQRQFSTYTLRVKTLPQLTAVSQGEGREEDGLVVFQPGNPLPQISLVIGPYRKRSVAVDSVTYNLFTHRDHRYFEEYTNALTDTLASLIRELKNDYELRTRMDYPFKSFSIIEAPIHFTPLSTPLVWHKDYLQPMQVLLPENGAPVSSADFKRNVKRARERLQDRNQSMSETEVQVRVLRYFVENELFGMTSFRRSRSDWGIERGALGIFPNYYHFSNSIQSVELPLFDPALEAYLKGKVEYSGFSFMRFRQAITDEEKACLKLREQSLSEVLSDPQNIDIANSLLSAKSDYLFRLMESKVGGERLEQFLTQTLLDNRFTTTPARQFFNDLETQLNFSLEKELNAWLYRKNVPGFYFSNFSNYKVLDGDRQRYQVMFTVSNVEDVDGVVVVDFLIPGGRRDGPRFNRGASDYQRAVYVPAGAAKEVAVVLDDQPRAMTLNTLVSRNLPSQAVHRLEEFEQNNKAKPLDGERLLDEPPKLSMPGEYIVDNEDDGFKVLTKVKQTPLKRLLRIRDQEEDEYRPFRPWRGPQVWSKTINSLFYGELVHSAHYIRAGDGNSKVAWEIDLPESGQYAIYAYGESLPMHGRRARNFVKDFHYSVYHDDGVEEVEWSVDSAEGWNYLGSYYLSAGINKVELSNKSKGRIVIADAVKWVK